jgi:uncharacterized repeat protein (TIGR03847 family)
MPRQLFVYDPPERFVAGTVGEPGARTFYLQASGGGRTTSVALEKNQVEVLAERVGELLDEVLRLSGGTAPVPAEEPAEIDDLAPLDAPITEEFRVGAIALAWDGADDRVVIEAHAPPGDDDSDADVPEIGDDESDGPDVLRVRMSAAAARAFSKRALAVVAAGRPSCPFCAMPLDPEGHVCARANGYRRRG